MKADDASVPVKLWNDFLFKKHFPHIVYLPIKHKRALEVLRNKFALRIYVVNTVTSFFKFVKVKNGDNWLSFYLAMQKQVTGKNKKRKRDWNKRKQ